MNTALIDAYIDGEITPSEMEELDAWVRSSRTNAREFTRRAMLHGCLDQQLRTFESNQAKSSRGPWIGRTWQAVYDVASNYITLSLLISTIVMSIIVLSMGLIVPDWNRIVPGDAAPSIEFIAVITDTQGATWDKKSDVNFESRSLLPGDLAVLNGGLAEITYEDGVKILIEGPCTYVVDQIGVGTAGRGRIVAKVPAEAIGFTIHTPVGSIVDLGTEFGVEVTRETTITHVFSGKVEFQSRTADGQLRDSRQLVAGETMEIAKPGGIIASVSENQRSHRRFRRAIATLPPLPRESDANVVLINFRANPAHTSLGWNDFTGHEEVLKLLSSDGEKTDISLKMANSWSWLWANGALISKPHVANNGVTFPANVLKDLGGENRFGARDGQATIRLSSPAQHTYRLTLAAGVTDPLPQRTVCNVGGVWDAQSLTFLGGNSVEFVPDQDGESIELEVETKWDEESAAYIVDLQIANGSADSASVAGLSAIHVRVVDKQE